LACPLQYFVAASEDCGKVGHSALRLAAISRLIRAIGQNVKLPEITFERQNEFIELLPPIRTGAKRSK
jgi:hypothetical protein